MTWRSLGGRGPRGVPDGRRISAFTSLLLVAMLIGGGTAAGQPLTVVLRLDRCQPEPLDPGELASLLQVELPSIVSREVRVSQSPGPPLADPAALQVDIQCHDRSGNPLLIIESQQPVAHVQTTVPLTDVLAAERTRTLAMAIAESLRALQDQLPAPAIFSGPSAAAIAELPARSTGRRPWQRRTTVALLSVSGITLTAGLVLGSLAWSNLVHGPGGEIVGGIGYGALGISVLSLASLGLTLGLNPR